MKYFMVLFLLLAACSKNVSSEQSPAPAVPKNSPGIVVNDDTGVVALTFADHTQYGSVVQDVTSIQFSQDMSLILNSKISNTPTQTGYSFDPTDTHAYSLDLYLNNIKVCTYNWNGTAYQSISSCQLVHGIHAGDKMYMVGVPVRESVSVYSAYYK